MVTLSDRAASEVKGLLEKQEKPDAMLRVFVAGGGCSGFQYGMSLEEEASEGDQTFDLNGVKVIIDPRSAQFIGGAEIEIFLQHLPEVLAQLRMLSPETRAQLVGGQTDDAG